MKKYLNHISKYKQIASSHKAVVLKTGYSTSCWAMHELYDPFLPSLSLAGLHGWKVTKIFKTQGLCNDVSLRNLIFEQCGLLRNVI